MSDINAFIHAELQPAIDRLCKHQGIDINDHESYRYRCIAIFESLIDVGMQAMADDAKVQDVKVNTIVHETRDDAVDDNGDLHQLDLAMLEPGMRCL